MQEVSTEQIILEVSKSPELVSAFQLVAESDVDGEPKYAPGVCRDLARAIACRTYSSALLELCHLLVAAEACGGGQGWEGFFWGMGPARPSAFRGALIQGLRGRSGGSPRFAVGGAGVDVDYPDSRFSITYKRMPFLSALAEFLITTVGYTAVDEATEGLFGVGVTANTVSGIANGLARTVYEYLKDHLPTAQNQRKFRRLIEFMEGRAGESFGIGAIDDAAVLDFWIAESASASTDGVDFRTYRMALESFVRFREALEGAADMRALETPRVIGFDREAGEVDPDAILAAVETADDYRSPILILQEPPAEAIKFLNKKETETIELLFDYGPAAFTLPVSVMRCLVFGLLQAQITQALRRKVDDDALTDMIEGGPGSDYDERKAAISGVLAHLGRVRLASLHILARNVRREAVNLVIALRPEIDFSALRSILQIDEAEEQFDNVVRLHGSSVADRFVALAEDAERVGPEIAGLMADARKAFRGLSRAGFGDEVLDDPDIVEGHARATASLIDVAERLSAFIELLERITLPHGDWRRQFEADRAVFAGQFKILYGGHR